MNITLRTIVPATSLLGRRVVQVPSTLTKVRPIWRTYNKCLSVVPDRGYAKKTNKKKNPPSLVTESSDATEPANLLFDERVLNNKFGQAVNALKEQFSSLRIGRANPAILDKVRVHIDDVNFSLRDLAQVTIRDPQTLLVTVHEAEYQAIVDKSIREAGLNLNPVLDSKIIRVPIPKPTKDSRDKMAKLASQAAEQIKSRIRLVRQDGMKQLKADAKSQSKDDTKKMEKLIQTLTDKYNKEVDDSLKVKLREIHS